MSNEQPSHQDIFTARQLGLALKESFLNKTYSLSEYKTRFPSAFHKNREDLEPDRDETILKRIIETEIQLHQDMGFLPSDEDIEEAYTETYAMSDEDVVTSIIEGIMSQPLGKRHVMLLGLKLDEESTLTLAEKKKIFKQVGFNYDEF